VERSSKLKDIYSGEKMSHNFKLVNADTDSIAFSRPDGSAFSEADQAELLAEINSLLPERIRFEHDGVFEKVIVVRAKNYVLFNEGKIKIKGSGLKVTNKEIALKECIGRIVNSLLGLSTETPVEIYYSYVMEIMSIKDISRWASKKTVTKSVLNPERSTEEKILKSLGDRKFQEGDKIRVYFSEVARTIESVDKKGKVKTKVEYDYPLKLEEDWAQDHSSKKLLGKLYNNMEVFENVIDMNLFPNFTLKKNQDKLKEILLTTL
jgi:DNA polymerase elongation subunit (family B)